MNVPPSMLISNTLIFGSFNYLGVCNVVIAVYKIMGKGVSYYVQGNIQKF